MAEAATRTRGRVCVIITCLFLYMLLAIYSMLCFICIASWVKNKLAEENYKNAAITKLFEFTNSLPNKNQLEIFREILQTAVEEEERLKAEDYFYMVTLSRVFDEKVDLLTPKLELLESLSADFPELREIIAIGTRLLKNLRAHLDMKLALLEE
ncbi:unnamed protein product [Oreochromis niloticus]|nr:unnamed protein product [Mustela putorius furo]